MKYKATLFAALSLVLITGCDKAKEESKKAAVVLPAGLFVAAAPADVKSIPEVKKAVKEGDTVTIEGLIGGSEEPFIAGRAIFTIVDTSIKSCLDMPGDGCKTPWDYCCEPKENLTANTATIQIVGADGMPLKSSVEGEQGLKKLARIVVVGTVGKRDSDQALVVNAKSIHVKS